MTNKQLLELVSNLNQVIGNQETKVAKKLFKIFEKIKPLYEKYNADVYSTQSFSPDNVENFIPYEDLTFDIVCGWLESSMDVAAIDANLDTQIANLINPPIVSPPLPWLPTTTTTTTAAPTTTTTTAP